MSMIRVLGEKYPEHGLAESEIERMSLHRSSADPEDMIDIIPYIVSIHGKFYNMTEIPGNRDAMKIHVLIMRRDEIFEAVWL